MQKMKEKFSRIFSEQSKVNSTFVSIVALIIAIVISVSTVSAWVETISTIKVMGSGKVDTKLKTAAVIKSSSTDSIDLTQYFRKAGNVHLSVASSADGETFFFPVVSSTGTTAYRKGTVNDENVNYIKFSLNVSSPDSKDYGYQLAQVPGITIGGVEVDKSAVRIAITDETAGTTVVMSKVSSTTPMPHAVDGTTATTTVTRFSNYVNNDIFTINKGETHKITVKLWLQDVAVDTFLSTYSSQMSGNAVEVTNFIIEPSIPKYKIKAIAVTNGTESGTGGTVQVGSASAGATSEEEVNDGGSVTLKATAKTGYKFDGWYDAATGGSKKSSNASYSVSSVTKAQTYYARFVTAYTVKAVAITNGSQSSTGGTVLVGSNTSSGVTSTDTIATGKTTTFKATVKSDYAFLGWFKAASGGTAVSTDDEYTTTITATTTLYARFVSTYKVTAHAVTDGTLDSATGGTVKIGSGTASAKAEDTVNKGESVTFTADPEDGYTFEGWFAAQTGGTALSTSTTYTISDISSAHTVYARFKMTERKIYFQPNSNWTQAEARFAAYVWDDSGNKWYSMGDGNGDGVYSATIDPKYKNIIFVRMNGANTTNNWDNKWNQTGDLTIPDGKNKFTLNSGVWDGDSNCGTWSLEQ